MFSYWTFMGEAFYGKMTWGKDRKLKKLILTIFLVTKATTGIFHCKCVFSDQYDRQS
jgi:hypothetical protein